MSEKVEAAPRRWDLESESEYRFELDAGTSLAVKVGFSWHWEAPLKSIITASRRPSGDLWFRISGGENLSLWLRVQGCRLHVEGLCN